MTYCAQCGSEVAGRFCAKCGASAGGFEGAAYASAPVAAAGLTENVASALCYLLGLITGVIFLLVAPYNQNKNIRFHAFQSIFFHLAAIAFWIVFWGISGVMSALTHGVFALITLPISLLVGIALFGLWLYLMYAAYSGKPVVLPGIGPLAKQQA